MILEDARRIQIPVLLGLKFHLIYIGWIRFLIEGYLNGSFDSRMTKLNDRIGCQYFLQILVVDIPGF